MLVEVNGVKIQETTVAYIETALWASTISLPVPEENLVDGCMDGEPFDKYFDISDLPEETILKADEDCNKFLVRLGDLGLYEKALEYEDDFHIVHDFWLTRNGHGAGFWDGDYGEYGDALTSEAREFGESYLYLGDDGKVYLVS